MQKKNMSSKHFREYFEKKVRNTIRKERLLSKTDRIAVAVSGGKDSTACLHMLHKLGYDVEAVTIDVCVGEYSETNLENLKGFCRKLDIKLHIFSFKEIFGKNLNNMRNALKKQGLDYSYCMICGILKRYLLNRKVREMQFDAIATGHNLDDEAQAFLMNVFRNDFKLAVRQGPMPGVINAKKFIKRVKPLFFMREDEVKRYSRSMRFPVNYNSCPYSKKAFRKDFREMLDVFEKKNPSLKYNIMHFQLSIKTSLKQGALGEIGTCTSCKEPSSNDICKACEIIGKFTSQSSENKS